MLVVSMIKGYSCVIIDVETAFLHGDLEEEIFMDCPQGLENEPDECLKLNQSIYGLVQSARQFYKKFVTTLRKIGFTGGYADPCLLTRKSDKGIVHLAIYVDDNYCIGDKEAIEEVIGLIKENGFTVKVEYDMTDYLSCNILFSKDKKKAWLGQPHLMKKIKEKFSEMTNNVKSHKTPGNPNNGLIRSKEDDPSVSKEEHAIYRSGVGMLLYLVKHSRPDLANATRELSKLMDKPTPAAMKELKRVLKFTIDTQHYGLKMEPTPFVENKVWNIMLYSDSDWAGDKDTRISVTGYIIFLQNVPICWKSKGQKSVALSSSEAELVALSEAAKEVKFIYQVMGSMNLRVKLPIICRVDNVGAIFMAENTSTSPRTKHLDLRYRFITEFIEDGFIKILFVKTDDNISDPFTKNVSSAIYEAHTRSYVADKKYLEQ